jgi:hypothetical protein
LLGLIVLAFTTLSAYSQKYRSVADTGKLNLEYVKVSNEIASLTSQLSIAKNDLAGYQSKASNAETNAENAASSSSDQATKATNGSVSDARSAKRKAKKAFREAKDSRSANSNVNDQDDKIARLSSQLLKKEQRLQELEAMRTSIHAQQQK